METLVLFSFARIVIRIVSIIDYTEFVFYSAVMFLLPIYDNISEALYFSAKLKINRNDTHYCYKSLYPNIIATNMPFIMII